MRLFVPLNRDDFDRLSALAQAERRRPQDQAAILLSRSLASLALSDHRLSPRTEARPESSLEDRHGESAHP